MLNISTYWEKEILLLPFIQHVCYLCYFVGSIYCNLIKRGLLNCFHVGEYILVVPFLFCLRMQGIYFFKIKANFWWCNIIYNSLVMFICKCYGKGND